MVFSKTIYSQAGITIITSISDKIYEHRREILVKQNGRTYTLNKQKRSVTTLDFSDYLNYDIQQGLR